MATWMSHSNKSAHSIVVHFSGSISLTLSEGRTVEMGKGNHFKVFGPSLGLHNSVLSIHSQHSVSKLSVKHVHSIFKSILFIKPFLHLLMSQSAVQKPSLKPQTASNAGVEARWLGKTP
jgi:hypothetical protein